MINLPVVIFIIYLIIGKIGAFNFNLIDDVVNQVKQYTDSHGVIIKSKIENTLPSVIDQNTNLTFSGKKLPNYAKSKFPHLINYGCYCNFDSQNLGFGIPVDPVDKKCKQLFLNYHCLELNNCDLKNLDYKSGSIYFFVAQAVAYKTMGLENLADYSLARAYDECDLLNEDYCAAGACKADVRFTFELLPEGMHQISDEVSDILPNKQGFYSAEFENLDNNKCKNPSARKIGASDKNYFGQLECCGESPYKVRFNTIVSSCVDNSVINIFS